MINSIFEKASPITKSDTANFTVSELVPVQVPTEVAATSVDLGTDTITKNSHGLNNGDVIVFTSVGTVTNITAGVQYFVVGQTANTFQVAATLGGTAINLTGANTTAPTYQRLYVFTTGVSKTGAIYVGGDGDVLALPAEHPNTNSTTPATLGAILFTGVKAGTILPGIFKRVYSTTTDATGLVLLHN